MISRAIEIDPGNSNRDGESLLQSPWSSASRTSARVNHAASAISPSLNENSCSGSLMVGFHALGDLANHARLERLAGFDESGQQRE